MDSIAQGRVWTGTSALKIGLVDQIGGLDDAIRCAAELAEMGDTYKLKELPQEEDNFMKLFSGLTGEAARFIYGDEVYEQHKIVEAFKQRTGVQALVEKTKIQ